MAGPQIVPQQFWDRLQVIHKDLTENGGEWGDASSLVIVSGKGEEDATVYWNSVAIQLYLFDCELPESIMVLTKDKFYYHGSSSKIKKLQGLADYDKKPAVPALEFIAKPKKDDNTPNLQQLVDAIQGAGASFGSFPKEEAFGEFAAEWKKVVEAKEGLSMVDATSGLQGTLGPKDAQELRNAKVASVLSCAIMRKHVYTRLQTVVDDEATLSQTDLVEEIEARFDDPTKLNWAAVNKINVDRVDMSYPPIVQSGGKFNLKPNAETEPGNLHYGTEKSPGVMLVSFGARYKGYCANLCRTYMVNPTAAQSKAYSTLLELQAHLLRQFKVGTRVGDIMAKAKEFLQDKAPELVPKFVKNCGSGMGIVFRERHFLLTAKNDNVMREGMTFNLSIGFDGLEVPEADDAKSKTYVLMLSDTVVVKAAGTDAEVLTQAAPSKIEDVVWTIGQEEEEEDLEQTLANATKAGGERKRDALAASAGDERKDRQMDIATRQREEAIARFKKKDADLAAKGRAKLAVAYEHVGRYPRLRHPGQIFVDSTNDSVFFPIFGQPVPIHVAYIKNISRTADAAGRGVEIRINLITPGVTINEDVERAFKDPRATFLRELTYKSTNPGRVNTQFQMINATKKAFQTREKERQDSASLVKMDQLKMYRGTGRPPSLPDCTVKPSLGGRGKRSGTLEIHANGVRYKSPQNPPLDITYQNIKYAFYQDAVNELKSEYRDDTVRIHVHLKNDIMVGKKKTKDVQFCTAIGEENIKLSDVRRSAYDPDELEDEQRERERRRRFNNLYKKFAMMIQDESKKTPFEVEFDIPYKDLVFSGRASLSGHTGKGEVSFMPTKDCLVDLSDSPFFIMDIAEVEVVYFERVTHNLKYFDIVFICKDYETWVRIDSIPTKKLETVKTWVDSVNVRYYEGALALKWKDVLKEARSDPEGFWDEGGWDAYLGEDAGSAEEEDSESESDEGYSEEDAEAEEEDEDSEEYDDENDDEDDSGSEFEGEEDLSEEGEDWDEAESRLQKEDNPFKRGGGDDDGDGRPKKKKKR